jgi:outer membrane receptor protein involved in Fe transport
MSNNNQNAVPASALIRKLSLGAAAIFALSPLSAAIAADSEAELMKELDDVSTALEEVIVTGTTGRGITVLESSVAVTQVSAEDLARQAPFGLADSVKSVPGLYAQDSGGQTSNSVGVRGLPASQHFEFISVQEDGLPVSYDRYTVDAVQRYDIGIERFEATRGGTSGVLAPNGAGAIINYITKKGTDDPEGTLKLTATDYENVRADFFWGGPLAEDWKLAVSGYWQAGGTPRDTGFTAERGGQIRLNLTRELENGELNLSYKHISESNSFVLPLPLYRDQSGDLKEIPGFDLNHGNTTSFENSRTRILFADGSSVEANAQDGADTEADVLTVSLDLELDENWSFRHASRVTDLNRSFNGIWTGSAGANSLMDAENYLADGMDFGAGYGSVGDFYAANAGTQRCFQYVSSKQLVCEGDAAMDTIGGNGLVQILNALNEPIERKQIMSDTRFTFTTDNNSLSFGLLYADIRHKRALQTSFFLSEVSDSDADVLDIVAVDGNGNVQAYLSDGGVVKHGHWRGNDDMQLTSYSFYVNDEYQVNDDLRLDAGLRYENAEYKGIGLTGLGNRYAVAGAFDANGNDVDNILANNYATRQFGSGVTDTHSSDYSELAWTLGFNYVINEGLAVYGRYAEGFQTPRADRLGDIRNNGLDTPVSELSFVELGIRYQGDVINTSATLFQTNFDNLLTGGLGFDASGSQRLFTAELEVTGVEFDLGWSPTDWITLEAQGVFQSAELGAISNPSIQSWKGNTPARTPDTQVRVSPTFHVTDELDVFMTYHYLGKRYGANDNIVEFDACGSLDVGGSFLISEALTLQIKGKNITNEVCYNEGNPRATSTENALAYGFARPIAGATWMASISYDF